MAPIVTIKKLARAAFLSSLGLFALVIVNGAASAHEVRPAIADVAIGATSVEIEIELALEALIAEIDLTGIADTDETDGADRYDTLRALPPEALLSALTSAFPRIAQSITLRADGTELSATFERADIPEIGDLELPRDSRIFLRADLPADESALIFGWDASNGPLIVRQVSGDQGYNDYLTNGDLSQPMPRSGVASKSWITEFVDYIKIGFAHIIPKGLDHILFVLGLFFFSLKLRPLLLQITAFTLAHTLTLALAIVGIVQVPASIVEPLIAASIVFVAVENIVFKTLTPWRLPIVFGFGLLHGLGFASVLGDIGLDPARFATGLIGFNIGVEIGQLTVIAMAFLAVGLWLGKRPMYRTYVSNPASAAIAVVGAYWFVERVFL